MSNIVIYDDVLLLIFSFFGIIPNKLLFLSKNLLKKSKHLRTFIFGIDNWDDYDHNNYIFGNIEFDFKYRYIIERMFLTQCYFKNINIKKNFGDIIKKRIKFCNITGIYNSYVYEMFVDDKTPDCYWLDRYKYAIKKDIYNTASLYCAKKHLDIYERCGHGYFMWNLEHGGYKTDIILLLEHLARYPHRELKPLINCFPRFHKLISDLYNKLESVIYK